MTRVLRWGRSAYETSLDLDGEEQALSGLGCTVARHEGPGPDVAEVEVLVVCSKVPVGESLFARAPRLGLVVTTTSGYDHIDLAAAEARGLVVSRCPLARRDAVVDTSLAMGLALLRDLPDLQRAAEAGVWARGSLPGRAMGLVRGLDVGVIGYGVIGRRATEAWRSLGAKVRWHDPAVSGSLPLADLFELSRLVTLHCSLTPTSERILDAAAFGAMAPGSIVINTARGRCVDLDALVATDHLGGVGLDVFPVEPVPDLAALAARPRTLLSPHASGYHPGLGAAIALEVEGAVEAWLEGGAVPHRVGGGGG